MFHIVNSIFQICVFTSCMRMSECVSHFSCVWLFATSWTVACLASLSLVFSRQEHWSGLSCSSLGDLPDLGTEPRSSTLQADSLPSEPPRNATALQSWVLLKSSGKFNVLTTGSHCFGVQVLSPYDRPMNQRWGVDAKNMTLLRKLTDQEHGTLLSQNNNLIRVWMPFFFLNRKRRVSEKVK